MLPCQLKRLQPSRLSVLQKKKTTIKDDDDLEAGVLISTKNQFKRKEETNNLSTPK